MLAGGEVILPCGAIPSGHPENGACPSRRRRDGRKGMGWLRPAKACGNFRVPDKNQMTMPKGLDRFTLDFLGYSIYS